MSSTIGHAEQVLDSDVTISLIKAGAVHVLGGLSAVGFLITETNYSEIRKEESRRELDAALARGDLEVRTLSDPEALLVFARLLNRLDNGEAATIALASQIGADVAMHDKAGRRTAVAILTELRVHRLEDILVEAVRVGCLTDLEADRACVRLVDSGDYVADFVGSGIAAATGDPRYGFRRDRLKA